MEFYYLRVNVYCDKRRQNLETISDPNFLSNLLSYGDIIIIKVITK